MTGAKVPTDRIIDGVDMSSILFQPSGKVRKNVSCLVHVYSLFYRVSGGESCDATNRATRLRGCDANFWTLCIIIPPVMYVDL